MRRPAKGTSRQMMLRNDAEAAYAVMILDMPYRTVGGETLLARVYRPGGDGVDGKLFPALLDVHGGAWSTGTRENNSLVDAALAAAGLVVMAVDFRLAPVHPYPASIEDVNYATRCLKSRGVELGADPQRPLGVLGCSSGGHVAMLSALRPRDRDYAAAALVDGGSADFSVDAAVDYAILCWPVIDPHARYRFAQATGQSHLVAYTEGYFRSEEVMREANPQRVVESGSGTRLALPPVLLIQGTEDMNLPPRMAERFAANYRAAGGEIQLELFPGQPHGFAYREGPETARAIGLMKRFVEARLSAASGANAGLPRRRHRCSATPG
jgi:acetyl esterase